MVDDACVHAQLRPTLCDPMDCSPPGSSVHGISEAGILEWVAIFFYSGELPDLGFKPTSLGYILHWQVDCLEDTRVKLLLLHDCALDQLAKN